MNRHIERVPGFKGGVPQTNPLDYVAYYLACGFGAVDSLPEAIAHAVGVGKGIALAKPPPSPTA